MKIAIVHDYLIDYGGAERVLSAMHETYPEAPIYVSILDKKGMGDSWKEFENAEIIESWFGKIPFAHRLVSPLRFLLPLIWRSFDFSGYDIVITSAAWAVTKGVNKGKNTKEICYIHTPPRWLYGYDESRSWDNKWYGWAIKIYASIVGHFLRMYDFNSAQKVDYYAANSKNVSKRVEKFYRREVDSVIHPPVDVERYHDPDILMTKSSESEESHKIPRSAQDDNGFYLTGGRLVNAKNFDLIIKAFNEFELPLKIYGNGPLKEHLLKISNSNIEFVGRVDDDELVYLYQKAKAYIVAQKDEDFGITPVEAMAAGTPVIAYKGGGYKESVIDGKTGLFFDELSKESLMSCVRKFNKNTVKTIKKKDLQKQAEKFSKKRFKKEFKSFVNKVYTS